MKYTRRDMAWMALGELGSYLISFIFAVMAFMRFPISFILLKVFVAVLVFIVSAHFFHWFIHYGFVPDDFDNEERQ